MEENIDLSGEDIDQVMEVIQEDKISFNITSTKHRNATVTKEKFKLLMNDTEDLGTSKLI